jgi:hypothetical protein
MKRRGQRRVPEAGPIIAGDGSLHNPKPEEAI